MEWNQHCTRRSCSADRSAYHAFLLRGRETGQGEGEEGMVGQNEIRGRCHEWWTIALELQCVHVNQTSVGAEESHTAVEFRSPRLLMWSERRLTTTALSLSCTLRRIKNCFVFTLVVGNSAASSVDIYCCSNTAPFYSSSPDCSIVFSGVLERATFGGTA